MHTRIHTSYALLAFLTFQSMLNSNDWHVFRTVEISSTFFPLHDRKIMTNQWSSELLMRKIQANLVL